MRKQFNNHIDETLVGLFKTEVERRGMRINIALERAMSEWLDRSIMLLYDEIPVVNPPPLVIDPPPQKPSADRSTLESFGIQFEPLWKSYVELCPKRPGSKKEARKALLSWLRDQKVVPRQDQLAGAIESYAATTDPERTNMMRYFVTRALDGALEFYLAAEEKKQQGRESEVMQLELLQSEHTPESEEWQYYQAKIDRLHGKTR